MAGIKLNSAEWCDFIFGEKNKTYGAYRLRQSSSKRHLVAFGCTIIIAIAAAAIPTVVGAIQEYRQSQQAGENIDVLREMTKLDLEEQVPEENIIKQETAPPPPPLKTTVRFVPPVIAADEDVADDIEVHTQEDLMSTRDQISIADVVGDDDEHGIDIAELEEQKVIIEEKPQIFTIVEQMPSFPGGEAEMMKFIGSNLRYPVVAQESGIQGRVVVRFVVTKEGNIDQVEVVRGIDPSCDREAMRVVKSMPKWTPGRQNGKSVPVYFTLPILFRLK